MGCGARPGVAVEPCSCGPGPGRRRIQTACAAYAGRGVAGGVCPGRMEHGQWRRTSCPGQLFQVFISPSILSVLSPFAQLPSARIMHALFKTLTLSIRLGEDTGYLCPGWTDLLHHVPLIIF